MNTITNLAQTNPRIAEEVVQDLTDLFRAALSDAIHDGIQALGRPGLIQLSGRYDGPRVSHGIRNTLPGVDEPGPRQTDGNRMAREDVIQRLTAMLGGQARVVNTRSETHDEVRLIFPHPWKRP